MPTVSDAVFHAALKRLAEITGQTIEEAKEEAKADAAAAPPVPVTLQDIDEGNFTYCTYFARNSSGYHHKFVVIGSHKEHAGPEAVKYVHRYIDPSAVVIEGLNRGKDGANLSLWSARYHPEARELVQLPVPPELN